MRLVLNGRTAGALDHRFQRAIKCMDYGASRILDVVIEEISNGRQKMYSHSFWPQALIFVVNKSIIMRLCVALASLLTGDIYLTIQVAVAD